ncbi:MAG TPA: Ig-like domain-containing protein [Thermoanaerobaculia bacterium]|nr:Ig-like domain-containing protein [Thermoanaerobaculia bacterium]
MMNVLLLAVVSFPLVLVPSNPGTVAGTPEAAQSPHASLGVPEPEARACSVVWPVAGDDYVSTTLNTPVTFRPLDNDTDTPEQDLLSFEQPAHGTAERVGLDAIKYTPATGYTGSDSFTYTLFGCLQCFQGGCTEPEFDEGTVYITVTN